MKKYFSWHTILPVLACLAYLFDLSAYGPVFQGVTVALLMGSVLSAVHHSEAIAHRVGEPFGTIILAVSITIIEVALIISLMLAGGEKAVYLARDTVFSAVMILMNGILGLAILVGGIKHFEQFFERKSMTTAMVSLVAILVFTLILPNFTQSIAEPRFTTPQLFFVTVACLFIYGSFLAVQTIRHKNYFIPQTHEKLAEVKKEEEEKSPEMHFAASITFLLLCLAVVVLMAKSLSPLIEKLVIEANLPQALAGIVIATVVLLPEGVAAVRAAWKNDIQTSINLSFGSALAAIGLTIPAVAIVSYLVDIDLILGLEPKSMLLLGLSIFVVMLSLSRGKTNIIYGVVLLINLCAFIVTTIFP